MDKIKLLKIISFLLSCQVFNNPCTYGEKLPLILKYSQDKSKTRKSGVNKSGESKSVNWKEKKTLFNPSIRQDGNLEIDQPKLVYEVTAPKTSYRKTKLVLSDICLKKPASNRYDASTKYQIKNPRKNKRNKEMTTGCLDKTKCRGEVYARNEPKTKIDVSETYDQRRGGIVRLVPPSKNMLSTKKEQIKKEYTGKEQIKKEYTGTEWPTYAALQRLICLQTTPRHIRFVASTLSRMRSYDIEFEIGHWKCIVHPGSSIERLANINNTAQQIFDLFKSKLNNTDQKNQDAESVNTVPFAVAGRAVYKYNDNIVVVYRETGTSVKERPEGQYNKKNKLL